MRKAFNLVMRVVSTLLGVLMVAMGIVWMLQGLDDGGRARALEDLRVTLAAHETSDGVLYDSATWTISGTRR